MKLITLNTHSLVEENYQKELDDFVYAVAGEKPDIIALQEVNQSISAVEEKADRLNGFTSCGNIPVKADNHALNTVRKLYEKGLKYYWTWLGIKKSYEIYEEGIALLSLSPVVETAVHTISSTDDYGNWKTRKVVGIRTEKYPDEWFYSVHFGWWNDSDEPFQSQWKRFSEAVDKKEQVWLMGDFNSPAELRGEGYDMVKTHGWHDSFLLAKSRDKGVTVKESIDGWHGKKIGSYGMRIDQIWSRREREILSSQVVFNGNNYPIVSDHYGVKIEVKD